MRAIVLLLVGVLILPSAVAGSDFGVVSIVVPTDTVRQNSQTMPVVMIHAAAGNLGPETVHVQLRIGSSYLDTASHVLAPGENRAIPFVTPWQAGPAGTVTARCSLLTPDSNPANDTLRKVVTVLALLVDFSPTAIATTPPIVHLNDMVIPAVTVHADGSNPETETVAVRLRIGPFYDDTTSAELDPGDYSTLAFKPWQADSLGIFQLRCSLLVQDSAPANDTLSRGVTVYPPGSDFAVQAITAPPDTVQLDSEAVPTALVHAAEINQSESVSVRMRMGTAYDDTTDAVIQPGQTQQVTFSNWQADSLGLFAMRCSLLTPDKDSTNNAASKQVRVVETGQPGGPPSVQWSRTFQSSDTWGNCVQQTEDRGFVIAGSIATDPEYHFPVDIYLLKTDTTGNVQWQRTFSSGPTHDAALSVQQTADHGYVLAGNGGDSEQVIVLKTDSLGNQQWKFCAFPSAVIYNVEQTRDGGYIAAGLWRVADSLFLLKLDSLGNFAWRRSYGGRYRHWVAKIPVRQTSDGGYVISAEALVKTDSLGNQMWTHQYPGVYVMFSVEQTSDGGYVTTGIAPAPSEGESGNEFNMVLVKTDSLGNLGACRRTLAARNVTVLWFV